MKVWKIVVTVVLLTVSTDMLTQVSIGNTNPSDAAAFEVTSQVNGLGNHLGVLFPRVPTPIARDQIATTQTDRGMMVFVLSTGCLDLYNGNFWESINCTSSTPPLVVPTDVWINEFHYDNNGVDTNEFIEVAGRAGIDLSSYTLVIYNGVNGVVLSVTNLATTLNDDTTTGFGFESVLYPTNGLQNGSPDGIALVDPSGIVLQFLSYEGTFIASNGPASGMTSINIGVEQTGDAMLDPVGASLQLIGNGSEFADFMWSRTTVNTSTTENTGQTIN